MSASIRCTCFRRPRWAYEIGVTSKIVVSQGYPLPQSSPPHEELAVGARLGQQPHNWCRPIRMGIDRVKYRCVTVEPVAVDTGRRVHVGPQLDESPRRIQMAKLGRHVEQGRVYQRRERRPQRRAMQKQRRICLYRRANRIRIVQHHRRDCWISKHRPARGSTADTPAADPNACTPRAANPSLISLYRHTRIRARRQRRTYIIRGMPIKRGQ